MRKVYSRGSGSRWRAAVPFARRERVGDTVALDSTTLDVKRGEALGIIGPNGSGKTTLLKLIAGIAEPTAGQVVVNGSVGSMIELGLGFHPDLTGWENLYASAVVTGLTRADARAAMAEIVEFAGIRESMALPLKYFSLGMQARLAFALATSRSVDVLVVDEVLAVGDSEFQIRCIERIFDMVAGGTALILVSHEMPLISNVCSRAVQLRGGRVVDEGEPTEVVERYLTTSPSLYRLDDSPSMAIRSCAVPKHIRSTEALTIQLEVEVARTVPSPTIGVDLGLPTIDPDVTSASSMEPVPLLSEPGRYLVTGTAAPLHVNDAMYRVHVSLVDGDSQRVSDRAFGDCVLADSTYLGRGHLTFPSCTQLRSIGAPRSPTEVRGGRTTSSAVLRVEQLSKRYPAERRRTALRQATPTRAPGWGIDAVAALDDVTFSVAAGEAIGVIGPNGAGKSTLLRAIAGLVDADRGRVVSHSAIVPVLDLGVGLRGELSGLENMRVLAAVLGIPHRELASCAEEIVEFAGLADAISIPVRQYSAGMRARLAMAVALRSPGSILLIDELLAVGDEDYRRAVMDKVKARCREGTTVLFVSHELRLVEHLCERVLRFDKGRLVDDGPASAVIDDYGVPSWAAGVHDATSGVRMRPLEVTRRHLSVGDQLECRGQIIVERPMPYLRLDANYRHRPTDRTEQHSKELLERVTFLREPMVSAGDELAGGGAFAFRLVVHENRFLGDFDLVVTAFDERENEIVAESWAELRVGDPRPEGYPGPVLTIDWEVTPKGRSESPEQRLR